MNSRAIVLMYHNVGIPPKDAILKSLYVTPRMFRFQIWYLKKAGFEIVSLKEILAFIDGNIPDNKRLAAITFDDGYRDYYDNAYPVLKAYNFPSTVFLVSDFVGRDNVWDNKNVNARKGLLGWDLIHKLKKEGVSFGSHTKSHPFLSSLSSKEIEREVGDSRSDIEEELQLPVDFFCYPYGDYDERAIEAVRKSGYTGAVTTRRGLVHRDDSPFEIRRSFIRLNTHPFLFMYKLHSKYEDRKGLRL